MNDALIKGWKVRRARPMIALCAFVAGLCVAASANATLVYNSNIGGAPTGATLENFDNLPLGAGGGTTATGVTVSFNPDAQAVLGSLSGQYAAPFLTGNNGLGFGSPNQANGADATTYLTAGGTRTSSATLSWTGLQLYFGVLWGSVDSYNTLAFYNGASLVGSVTGSDVIAAANGNQGPDGTTYVNFDSTLGFDRVVMTSTQHAFEFDNVAFSANRLDLPEPGALGMMGLGLLAMAGLAFRRRKLASAG
jgi:hypothetical protein